jgi:peptidoglycan hydrolase CwlO-like protein
MELMSEEYQGETKTWLPLLIKSVQDRLQEVHASSTENRNECSSLKSDINRLSHEVGTVSEKMTELQDLMKVRAADRRAITVAAITALTGIVTTIINLWRH